MLGAHGKLLFPAQPHAILYQLSLSLTTVITTTTAKSRLKHSLLGMCMSGSRPKFGHYDSLLTECINQRALHEGQRVHAHIIKSRYLPTAYLGTRIIVMYTKCGAVDDARKVLEGMTDRSVASWTAVISGYAKSGRGMQAMEVFVRMMRSGILPNEFTLSALLSACAKCNGFEHGEQIHPLAVKINLESHIFVGSSLLDMYAKAGKIHEARDIFDKLSVRDVVSCTAIISGCAQLGLDMEVLELFRMLHNEGIDCNYVTFASLLTALSGLSALDFGRQVHGVAIRSLLSYSHVVLQNSLIDMYSKCGSLFYAKQVFNYMSERTIVSWNTLLMGYAKHGLGKEVIELFSLMQRDEMKPDNITFMAVLSGCCHGGLVDEGLKFLASMLDAYNVEPETEHYACVVDLLGRAGKVEKALNVIRGMPFDPTSTIWGSLLGACRFNGNISVAECAAEKLFEIEPDNSSNYVSLSNIYAESGRWEDASRIRRLMDAKTVLKEPGQSWIVLDKTKHSFQANDQFHPNKKEIYAKLVEVSVKIQESAGYAPYQKGVFDDVEQEEWILAHSEKLAAGQ